MKPRGTETSEVVATATEMKNQFGKYLQMVINGNEVIVTKNGQEV